VAAVGETGPDALSAAGTAGTIPITADLQMLLVQEGGPESGHVRIELTPESGPLTVMQARFAAEQAFLRALKEPGLGNGLRRMTVVVRSAPASHATGRETVIVFLYKGGRDWRVLPGP